MPKGYWIAHVEVTSPEPYSLYAAGATAAFECYGARVLARGGKIVSLEGRSTTRNVVIEFESIEQALKCYHSAEYQAAKTYRIGAGEADIMILEGQGE